MRQGSAVAGQTAHWLPTEAVAGCCQLGESWYICSLRRTNSFAIYTAGRYHEADFVVLRKRLYLSCKGSAKQKETRQGRLSSKYLPYNLNVHIIT